MNQRPLWGSVVLYAFAALVVQIKAGRGQGLDALLPDDQGIGGQPVPSNQRGQRLFPQTHAIGRIKEHKVIARAPIGAHIGGIAAPDVGLTHGAHQFDILSQQDPCCGAIIDKGHTRGPARQSLEPQGTGSGKDVQNAGILDRVAVAPVHDEVKDRLAHAVGRWAQMRLGIAFAHGGKVKPARSAADNPHFNSAFMLVAGSEITSAAGDLPISIIRLPTIYDRASFIASKAKSFSP